MNYQLIFGLFVDGVAILAILCIMCTMAFSWLCSLDRRKVYLAGQTFMALAMPFFPLGMGLFSIPLIILGLLLMIIGGLA